MTTLQENKEKCRKKTFLHIAPPPPPPAPTFSITTSSFIHRSSGLWMRLVCVRIVMFRFCRVCGFVCVRCWVGVLVSPGLLPPGWDENCHCGRLFSSRRSSTLSTPAPPSQVPWADSDPALPFDKPPPVWNDLSEWSSFVLRSATCFPCLHSVLYRSCAPPTLTPPTPNPPLTWPTISNLCHHP